MALTDNLVSVYLFGATVTADELGAYSLTNSGVTSNSTSPKIEATNGRFDGTDNMQQPAAATNSLNTFTLTMWVKGDATNVNYNLWAKNSATDRGQLGYTPSTGAYIQVNSSSALSSSGVLTATNWNHFMFASDGTDVYLVINGVVRAKAANTANLSASGNLYLGHNSVNTNERLAGYMEQCALWNVCIDGISGKTVGGSVTGDAADLYNSGTGLAYANWGGAPVVSNNAIFFGGGI